MLYELETSKRVELTTGDSTMVKPCLKHRAQLQRKRNSISGFEEKFDRGFEVRMI